MIGDLVIGLDQYMSKSKLSNLNKTKVSIEIGDIVAQLKYYRNGKPIPPHKFDYKDTSHSIIGIVIAQYHHSYYNTDCIKVKWYNGTKDGIYVKHSASAYLTKLS